MTSLIPAGSSPNAQLQQFETALLGHLEDLGLPSDGILVGIPQRAAVLSNLPTALSALEGDERDQAMYISKMIAAASAGLFDAALNYLWDETVGVLRQRVETYDLGYFFDVAVPSPDRRKYLSKPEDLAQVADVDLLRATKEMGLLSDVGHHQLDGIRYMRNHASAAHPNQIEISGLQLVSWLETCIRQVIMAPPDEVAAEVGRLLKNIKERRLTDLEAGSTAIFFSNLVPDRADSISSGLFGLYSDPNVAAHTADNVRDLWPPIWQYISDDARYRFGTLIARHVANADHDRAAKGRELFDLVDGGSFLPEPVRAAEISRSLEALLTAHHGWNNFATEPAPARALEELVGTQGDIPKALAKRYVETIVEVFLSNGSGITWAADPIYRRLIEKFDSTQAGYALRAFKGVNIASRLQTDLARGQWKKLLELLEPKLTRNVDRSLHDALQKTNITPDLLSKDRAILNLANPPAVKLRKG
ncbi:hypothetical protein [Paeniglutamicibacter psychrophenolicus]|uniref:hypothetical protein n=1 Tax=Paeniglutamicibacter psychrophenolicus TaxID=257454 RepID=UPI00278AC22B|nr:hypothetical protein [Paeniglutamicibacter psychrophenolicus]MDQ0093070.1 hypothetical protein [Paeniglutamicibacter psychrophenolicus]